MPWWVYLFPGILLLIITLAMFIPLRIFISYLRKNNNVQLAVYLRAGGWSYRMRKSQVSRGESMVRQPAVLVRIKPFLKKMSWKHFRLDLACGTGDPATTALLVGSGWALLSTAMAILNSQMRFDKIPRATITPLFNQLRLELLWEGEVSMSLIGWLRLWLATKKNGGPVRGKSSH